MATTKSAKKRATTGYET